MTSLGNPVVQNLQPMHRDSRSKIWEVKKKIKKSELRVWEFELTTMPALWNRVFLMPASTYSSKNHAEVKGIRFDYVCNEY